MYFEYSHPLSGAPLIEPILSLFPYATEKLAIHLMYFAYDAIFAGCSPKIRRSRNRRELIPLHLVYIMSGQTITTAWNRMLSLIHIGD